MKKLVTVLGFFLLLVPVTAHAGDVETTIAKHATAHGRKPPLALQLHALGAKALPSMLDMLAHGRATGATKLAVIEAVGLHRDPRSVQLLGSLLAKDDADYATARTVTEAIARMGTDDAVRRITSALATAKGDRARGILAGMGSCHREAIARALADRVSSADDATMLAIVRSLGDVGNAWAWQTLKTRGEETATRAIAARTLVDIYVHHASLRGAAGDALLVVDDPATPALVDTMRARADASTLAALDALAQRFAKSPLHAR